MYETSGIKLNSCYDVSMYFSMNSFKSLFESVVSIQHVVSSFFSSFSSDFYSSFFSSFSSDFYSSFFSSQEFCFVFGSLRSFLRNFLMKVGQFLFSSKNLRVSYPLRLSFSVIMRLTLSKYSCLYSFIASVIIDESRISPFASFFFFTSIINGVKLPDALVLIMNQFCKGQ